MPPKSLSSAAALIGLSALTAIEAGGCDKRPETLRSVTHLALPLVAQATRSTIAEMNYALSDYGLRQRPELEHVCGRYELRADGKLITWDLFVSTNAAPALKDELAEELKISKKRENAPPRRAEVSVLVESSAHFEWPHGCPKTLASNARSVLVASRVL